MTARTPPEAIVDEAVPLEVVDGNSGRVLARELPEGYVAVKAEVDAEWLLVCNLLPAGSPERDAAHSTRLAGASPIPLVAAWVATLKAGLARLHEENQRLRNERLIVDDLTADGLPKADAERLVAVEARRPLMGNGERWFCTWCETTHSDSPPCGEPAAAFIPRFGLSFACVLPTGHVGAHQRGGTCFAHGEYVGERCPYPVAECWKGAAPSEKTPT